MEAVVLNRVGFLEYLCPKQGQDFKPSAAPLYPNIGQVPPPPPPPPPGLKWGQLNNVRDICTFAILCSVTRPFLSLHSCS